MFGAVSRRIRAAELVNSSCVQTSAGCRGEARIGGDVVHVAPFEASELASPPVTGPSSPVRHLSQHVSDTHPSPSSSHPQSFLTSSSHRSHLLGHTSSISSLHLLDGSCLPARTDPIAANVCRGGFGTQSSNCNSFGSFLPSHPTRLTQPLPYLHIQSRTFVQLKTNLVVADNSGAKRVECIKVLKGARPNAAGLGDVIIASVKEAIPRGKVKKGEVVTCVVVRTAMPSTRSDGSQIRFDDTAAVIITKAGEPIGTRVFGPVPHELRARNYLKILTLAQHVI
eukprot:TRINITY_DN3032_c0_g1_i2.p1 TRINITY_DN3032_c0_g1~~TRINITY_DN3032_c0_g1_i2.p1  ORF type:complete len:282 (-),score=20.50 TRINITY_DN3032_c0_g1_i2:74-919(-)